MSIIHLMHGKEENLNLGKSKTGCRLTALHRDVNQWVYLENSHHVNCEGCLTALNKIRTLQSGRKK